MKPNSQSKMPEQIIDAIFALDLDPIKVKLMDSKEGHGWTRAQADRYALEYKRFLALVVKFPEEVIAPHTNVDKFWHGHILDTMKYAEDCKSTFGFFLHHFPYFGMRGAEDAADLARAAANMERLHAQEFGDTGTKDVSYCAVAAASYCAAGSGKIAEAQNRPTAYCAVMGIKYAGTELHA